MLELGYLPVGATFRSLHPETREEYALARTERKSGRGYRGFVVQSSPEVTLEDLGRRDLTINAIASSAEWTGAAGIIDPYDGVRDLRDKVLRHVTHASTTTRCASCAWRVLRRGLPTFRSTETLALMRSMVQHGEAGPPGARARVAELARGLMEAKPSRMFHVLRACGALKVVLPEVDRLWGVPNGPNTTPRSTPACT